MRSAPAAFILWLLCFAGLFGLHRFYLGRPWTGLLWLLTFGLLGIGQLIDLFLIPSMLREGALERRIDRMERERSVMRG
jgi:TM2 domain-containing membrane protein YozV